MPASPWGVAKGEMVSRQGMRALCRSAILWLAWTYRGVNHRRQPLGWTMYSRLRQNLATGSGKSRRLSFLSRFHMG